MEYLDPLKKEFVKASNFEKAQWMTKYMKDKFECLGIGTKERRDIQKVFFKEYGYPERDELWNVVACLWEQPHREYQYLAIELLQKFAKKLDEKDIDEIEYLIKTKSWWDSVDGLAAWICGTYFSIYPNRIEDVTNRWMKSGNMWLQRSVLLFQLKYKADTDTERLSGWIQQLTDHKDFFIRKAIGWILREYSKTNPDWVREFVANNELSGLSKREAMKYVNKG